MTGPVVPIRNHLLAALPPEIVAGLWPKLTAVALPMRQTLYYPGTAIADVYFLQSGMISMVANLEDGGQAEVGIIGREGFLGMTLLAGYDTPFLESMVQMPGTALRMAVGDFRRALDGSAPLRSVVLRYNAALHAQVGQTAACNGRHTLVQRLARWLLMAHDRADGDDLPLTQDLIAMMLGVHRPSVTVSARTLQQAGLVRHANGLVTVLDRTKLEAASCECYRTVQRRFAELLGPGGPPQHMPT